MNGSAQPTRAVVDCWASCTSSTATARHAMSESAQRPRRRNRKLVLLTCILRPVAPMGLTFFFVRPGFGHEGGTKDQSTDGDRCEIEEPARITEPLDDKPQVSC
jgi:hypothetical protein